MKRRGRRGKKGKGREGEGGKIGRRTDIKEKKVNGKGREGKEKGKRRKSEGDEWKERRCVKKNVLITQVCLQKAAAGWLELGSCWLVRTRFA